MRPDPLSQLKAAAAEDLAAQRVEARRARRHDLWARWVEFWKAIAAHLRIAATIVASATAIAGGAVGIARLVGLMRARDVARAEEPATGIPSTAADFIVKPEAHEVPERK